MVSCLVKFIPTNVKQRIVKSKKKIKYYNTYKLKIWETDEDRELGESFEYLESFNSVDDAINKAKKIISRNNYAFIEVIENETEELFFSTDGINEQYYREINSSMEL